MSDQDKQVALVAALHAGAERTGGTTDLHVARWLLSDDPLAAKTRRRQVVLVIPIVNPYGFFVQETPRNSAGVDPYSGNRGRFWDLERLEITEPEKAPELVAFKRVVDTYRPEIFIDNHGVAGHFAGHTVFETTGTAYSNYALRPWDWRVTERAIAAAAEAGYGSDRAEADAQRLFWGPELAPIGAQLWFGRPYFYTAHYPYARYHTLPITSEIGWEQSGLIRTRALLEIGNEAWPGGYPIDTIKSIGPHQVVAWGTTAVERRASRVELWERQSGFALAMLYPEADTRTSMIVATTPGVIEALADRPDAFLQHLAGREAFDLEALRAFVEVGPRTRLLRAINNSADPRWIEALSDTPVEHGLALRLRIAYADPTLIDLRLNGHPLSESDRDGYRAWYANGFTQMQTNIPPEKTGASDGLYIVTCAYAPRVQREYGWRPPEEVLRRLESPRP